MDLERLSVRLRQRNPWEAIDLGFAMAREWWRDLYGVWLGVLIPLAITACLLLPPVWAGLLVWWLKPALDRIVLHVLASAVFGSRPGWREALRAYPRYARNGLIGSLLWRRLSLIRSFTLPIRQLENARGTSGRARIAQLQRRVRSQAVWLTVICLNFETVAVISFVGLYVLLVPASEESVGSAFSWLKHMNESGRAYLGTGLWIAAIALIEPLYVAAGFALYLNRRTVLEGWDLEVQLRSVAQQAEQHGTATAARIAPAAALLIALGAAATVAGWPGSADAQTPTQSQAQQQIKEVLEQPVFGKYERQTRIEPLHPEPKSERKPDLKGFAALVKALALGLRVLVWVVLAVALSVGLYWLLRHLKFSDDPPHAPGEMPEMLFGLDVRPEALPRDVAAAALAHIARGELVAALSLLYRGALVSLLHRDGIELASGDTEADCLNKVKPRVDGATHIYLARLVTSWQAAAYAHRIPPRAEVEELATQWQGTFGTPGPA